MLAVGFEQEGVLVLSDSGPDEYIGKLGLERRMNMDFRLLDGDEPAF
jgi:hypothetical protein